MRSQSSDSSARVKAGVRPKEGGLNSYILIIYVVAFIGIFYFMAIRPQQRQRKAHQALLSSLKKGDTVVTAAGISGLVKRVEEDVVVIEVAKGVTMKFPRRAIVEIVADPTRARALRPEGVGGGSGRGKRNRAEIEETTEEDYAEAASEETESTELGEDGEDVEIGEGESTDESERA
jgi:preprotein translocase subunit YajC